MGSGAARWAFSVYVQVSDKRQIMTSHDLTLVVGHLLLVPHSPYFGPGLLASIHVCAAAARKIPIERYYCDFAETAFGEQIIPKNGDFAVPQEPGLGKDPDEVVIARQRVA